jgi:pimeloyl-ACP methyl ester carboxylesterase
MNNPSSGAEALKQLMLNPKYTKKKVRVCDGRILSYSECGNLETGMPVLFCFGLMTSSLAIMMIHHRALRNNLRIVAIDYPGIGESTIQTDRTLESWADDVSEVLDKLKIKGVRLLGHSLGGLHVLALLSNRSFKRRVIRTVLLCPWLYIEGESSNPAWMKFTHTLPDIVQSSIIPFILTYVSSSSMNLASWSNPELTQFQAGKLIMDYSYLQGQAGNEQMIRFALSKYETYLPVENGLDSSILIFHGKDDNLVSECRSVELVRLLKERKCDVRYTAITGTDHNSILSKTENLKKIMSSLVGDEDTWVSEIVRSLSVDPTQCMRKTHTVNEIDVSMR